MKTHQSPCLPLSPMAEPQHNVAVFREALVKISTLQLPEKDDNTGKRGAKNIDVERYTLYMHHITPSWTRAPAKFPKSVPKQIIAENVWTDDSKSEEPYADTDGESDWCPVELLVEVWTDQSYGAG